MYQNIVDSSFVLIFKKECHLVKLIEEHCMAKHTTETWSLRCLPTLKAFHQSNKLFKSLYPNLLQRSDNPLIGHFNLSKMLKQAY